MTSRAALSRHVAPLATVLALFAASRIWAWADGVRFDKSSLSEFEQYVDPGLLKHHLLQSIWYLHSQPPLYNLLLGLDLKIFGSTFAAAAHIVQIGLGIGIAVSLYALCLLLGLPRWWAAAVAALFAVSPAMILYENWLFYEYAVAALLLFSALAFAAFERKPTAWRSFLLFALLATICLIRASFQIVLPLVLLAVLIWLFRGHRRELAIGAAIPLLVLAGVSMKNWVLFGTPSTSSWTGMNLMQVDQEGFRNGEEQQLQQQGIVGPISAISVFQQLHQYKAVVKPSERYASIPVLHDAYKPSAPAATNFNNITYITISNKYLHDWVQILLHRPSIYLRGIKLGMRESAWPSTDFKFVVKNRAKIEPWVRGFDAAVLWQPHVTWSGSEPRGTAYGIIVFYASALCFGALELLRVLRRRNGSALVAFMWLLLAYATFVLTFAEVSENQRVRFVTDPIVTVLVAVLAARIATALRRITARKAQRIPLLTRPAHSGARLSDG